MELQKEQIKFIEDSEWIFAKTYAETWPHEYIVQERVDNDLFLALAEHIDTHGFIKNFRAFSQIEMLALSFTYQTRSS